METKPFEYNPKIGTFPNQMAVAIDVIIRTHKTDVLVKFWSGDILVPKETNGFYAILRILNNNIK